MKIFAFDNEGSCGGGEWKKCWASLGCIEVHKCSTTKSRTSAGGSIRTTCATGTALLLVHQGECESNVHDEVTSLLKVCPSLFVMYVSGGAQKKNDDSACPPVHYSRRIVPSGSELGYLKELFSKLCTALSNAGADTKKINLAWEEWESPVLVRLISMMAPLVLVSEDEVLFNIVAKRIRKDLDDTHLRLAACELADSEDEVALRNWMIEQTWSGGNGLSDWMQKYPEALRDLARRYL